VLGSVIAAGVQNLSSCPNYTSVSIHPSVHGAAAGYGVAAVAAAVVAVAVVAAAVVASDVDR